MKKTIKYTGIAAATLIALSPVMVIAVQGNLATQVKAESGMVTFGNVNEADFQYKSEVNVEQGSKVSDITPSLSDFYLQVNSQPLSKTISVQTDGKIYSEPNLLSEVDIGDTFNADVGTVYYRAMIVNFEGEARQFIVNGKPNWNNSKLTYNNQDAMDSWADTFVFSDSDKELEGTGIAFFQKITIVQETDPVDPTDPDNPGPVDPVDPTDPSNPDPSTISGIVTTHPHQDRYSIYDDDNSDAAHRSLGSNSSWRTDQVRTVDGVTQYRVSTHGWVNESDVTYIPDGELHSRLIVTQLDTPIKIHVSNEHPHHSLQDINRDFISHRALNGGTDWMVDKIGRDIHGRVYYGVSTNEFIHESYGVSVIK